MIDDEEDAKSVEDTEVLKEPAEEPPEHDFQADARKQGWVPQDEYVGDPDNWRDAEEFVRRGEEVLPIVKAKYDKRIARLEADGRTQEADFAARIDRMEKMNKVNLSRQAQQIRDQFEGRKRAAVEIGDTDAYDAAQQGENQALDEMRAQVDEANKDPETKPQLLSRGDQITVDEWMTENPWFKTDRVLNASADEYFLAINTEMPGASMADRLAEVRKRVADDFPKKFGIKPNGATPRVEGGNRQAGGGSPKGKYSTLPPEAKAAFADNVADGLYKNDTAGKEEYAAAYYED